MRFEEAQHRCQERWIIELGSKLIGPNSGQVEESLRPTLIAERCGKRSEG